MRAAHLFIALIISILGLLSTAYAQEAGGLRVDITNVLHAKGSIQIALFNKAETFPEQDAALYGTIIKVEGLKTYQWVLKKLDYGQYALAVFHDINNNGKLDKSLLGIPKEPYAFARKEPSKWRSPTFGDVDFKFDQPQQKLQVRLETWKNR